MPKKKKERETEKRPSIEEIYPHEYWLEKFNNEIRCTPKIFDDFLPNPKNVPLTLKFYSKHDFGDSRYANDSEKYLNMAELAIKSIPKQRYSQAILESHKYGWINENEIKVRYDENDTKRFFRPRVHGPLSLFAEKLVQHKITARSDTFTGTVFKCY